ncbi:MAG TPA: MFS transporter [Solirubrobacteraceae bacterium]|jgi:MFS family permease|nr:MFS transporter [Solirubrobacteraceae bacterium]
MRAVKHRVEGTAGGPARARIVVLFACVLALESADLATVGAVAPQLEAAFGISYAQLGLLAAVSTFVGALATVPFGALVDRLPRVRLLTLVIVVWALAMIVSALAPNYTWLLLSRVGLGAVTAAAAPAVASLTGDLFPASDRAKIYGYILSGELIGVGVGYVISGSLAATLSWRWGFAVLALPALALALALTRLLPEPARGGQSRLALGAQEISPAQDAATPAHEPAPAGAAGREVDLGDGAARQAIRHRHVEPIKDHVLTEDPETMSLSSAIRYVLSIRTNLWLITAAAIGYLFFAGMRTFALVFVRGQFSLGQGIATTVLFFAGLGAVAGVLASGRLADRLIQRGVLNARIVVGAVSYLMAPVVLVPALTLPSLAIAFPFLVLGAAAFSAPNPPLDAARLDIIPARLWGRAEGVRTLPRQSAQAVAPLLFGVVADALGGRRVNASTQITAADTSGLAHAFLVMLVPLAISGGILLWKARPPYARDMATALASQHASGPRGRTCPAQGGASDPPGDDACKSGRDSSLADTMEG